MKNEVKLTSVNILKEIYWGFKKKTVDSDMNLQKLVNRAIDLYNTDEKFKEQVESHRTSGVKNSKY